MRTLRMKFDTNTDKDYTLSVNYAKAGLTAEAVRTAMAAIRASGAFVADLVGDIGAEIVERNVTELF